VAGRHRDYGLHDKSTLSTALHNAQADADQLLHFTGRLLRLPREAAVTAYQLLQHGFSTQVRLRRFLVPE
jgi:hypothetical protein